MSQEAPLHAAVGARGRCHPTGTPTVLVVVVRGAPAVARAGEAAAGLLRVTKGTCSSAATRHGDQTEGLWGDECAGISIQLDYRTQQQDQYTGEHGEAFARHRLQPVQPPKLQARLWVCFCNGLKRLFRPN
eukprot:2434808-Rhodomonas_salina.2